MSKPYVNLAGPASEPDDDITHAYHLALSAMDTQIDKIYADSGIVDTIASWVDSDPADSKTAPIISEINQLQKRWLAACDNSDDAARHSIAAEAETQSSTASGLLFNADGSEKITYTAEVKTEATDDYNAAVKDLKDAAPYLAGIGAGVGGLVFLGFLGYAWLAWGRA